MKKLFLSVVLLGGSYVNAQDLHFSQTAQTPLLINPAAAGVYDGWNVLSSTIEINGLEQEHNS